MGQKPEEIVREIEETRDALGDKVDALAVQFRESMDVAKSRGLKVAAILGAAFAGILAIRKFRRR